MQENYIRVRGLVGQVRASTDWRACRGIMWTPPPGGAESGLGVGTNYFVEASGSGGESGGTRKKKRKKRARTFEELSERVAVLEEDLEERRMIFGDITE